MTHVSFSKEVRRIRKFERNFLAHYRKFVELLKTIMALKKPNPAPAADEVASPVSLPSRLLHLLL